MISDRQRFLAALTLYMLWIAGLGTLAATSATRPVNLQTQAAEGATEPAPAKTDDGPTPPHTP
jgi:hypothetical protein